MTTRPKEVQITFFMPEPLARRFKTFAAAKGEPLKAVGAKAFEAYLAQEEAESSVTEVFS